MSRFSIRNPYFIVVICPALAVIGVTGVVRRPADLFHTINVPETVATFYSGMPLAGAITGGLTASVVRTVFVVPAAY